VLEGGKNDDPYPSSAAAFSKPKVAHPAQYISAVVIPNLSKINHVNFGQRSSEGKKLPKEENDRLIGIYDSLIQLYVLRDQARKAQNLRQQDILEHDIAAVESRWHALRQKRGGSFH